MSSRHWMRRPGFSSAATAALSLLALLLAAGLLVQCARDFAPDQGEGGIDLVYALPLGMPQGVVLDSLRLWVTDGSGRDLIPPLAAPLAGSGQSVSLEIRVPAGDDRSVWMQFEGSGPYGRGTVAAGASSGLRILPGAVTSTHITLSGTVPELRAIEVRPGDLQYLVHWSRIPRALDYELREDRPDGTQTWVEPDTSRVLGLPGPTGFAGLLGHPAGSRQPAGLHVSTGARLRDPGRTVRSAVSDTTYYLVRSRMPRGGASLFSDSVGIYLPVLTDLPRLLAVNPVEWAVDVPDTAAIGLLFDRDMDPSSLRDTTLTLEPLSGGPAVPLTFFWARPDSLAITHPSLRWSEGYRLRVRPDLREAGGLGRPLDQAPQEPGLQGFESLFTVEAYDPLQVLSVTPAAGTALADMDAVLRIEFNRPVRSSTISPETIVLADSLGQIVPAERRLLSEGRVVEIDPGGPLRYGWGYRLTATAGVRDGRGSNGYPLDQDESSPYTFESFTSAFHTVRQPQGPSVERVVPEEGEQNAAPFRPIWIRFSEPVDPWTVVARTTFKVLQRGATVGGEVFHDAEARTFWFDPTQDLRHDLTYTVEVTPGVRDPDGNPLDEDRETAGYQSFLSEFRVEEVFLVDRILPSFNEQNVPIETDVTLRFGTTSVDLSRIDSSTLFLERNGERVPWSLLEFSVDTTRLVFRPEQPLRYSSEYAVHVDTLLLSLRGSRFDLLPGTPGYQPFRSTFTTEPESLPPRVTSIDPGPGERDVPVDTAVRVDFNVPIDPVSVNINTFRLVRMEDGVWLQGSRIFSSDGTSITFTPVQRLETSTDYRLEISPEIRDRYGVLFDQEPGEPGNQGFSSTFRTEPERIPPRVDPGRVHPVDATENVSVRDSVVIGFSEPMASLVNLLEAFSLRSEDGASTAGEGSLSQDGLTFTFRPASLLLAGTPYEIQVDTTAVDRAGNRLDQFPESADRQPFRSAFATEFLDPIPPSVLSSDPGVGEQNVPLTVSPVLHFSEPVEFVTEATVFVEDPHGVPVPVREIVAADDARSFTLVLEAPLLPNSEYTLVASTGVLDPAGNPLDQDPDLPGEQPYRADFHTLSQNLAPRVVAWSPPDGHEGFDPSGVLELVFSEPMDTLTAVFPNLALHRMNVGPVEGEITWDADRTHFYFRPSAGLVSGDGYRLVALSGLRDEQGTPLDQGGEAGADFETTFTVGFRPVADAGASVCDPAHGATVTVDGSASADADGSVIRATWDWGDGTVETLTTPGPGWMERTHVYPCIDSKGCDGLDNDGDGQVDEAGPEACDESYRIVLTVMDDDSLTASDTTGVAFCAFRVLPHDVFPPDGAAGVDTVLAAARVRLSRLVPLEDVNEEHFVLQDSVGTPVDVTLTLEAPGLTISLAPADTLLPNTLYILRVIPPFSSVDGRGFDQDPCQPGDQPFASAFRTAAAGLRAVPLEAPSTQERSASSR